MIQKTEKGKSAYEILKWFHSNSIATTFEQTYKLANLVSTITAATALNERSFSALKKKKKGQEGLSHRSLLSIQKAFVANLKEPSFYNQVTEKINALDRRAEFHFK
jgi:hypothetical protein